MKSLTVALFIVLAAFSAATYFTQPEAASEIPILYWVIDPAPARTKQIEQFLVWQIRHGHGKLYELKSQADAEAFSKRHWSQTAVQPIQEANPAAQMLSIASVE